MQNIMFVVAIHHKKLNHRLACAISFKLCVLFGGTTLIWTPYGAEESIIICEASSFQRLK